MTTNEIKPDQEDLDAVAATIGRLLSEEEPACHYQFAQLIKLRRLGIKEGDDAREERLSDLLDHIGYRLMKAHGPYLLFDLATERMEMDGLDLDGVEEFLIEILS
jgi:hypothetical protein